jgi:hypothetical protein
MIEQCRCMRCDSAIPVECISHDPLDKSLRRAVNRVSLVFCEHCRIVYRVHRVLRMGNWHTIGVSFLDDEQSVRDAQARLGLLRGDIQIRDGMTAEEINQTSKELDALEQDMREHGMIAD